MRAGVGALAALLVAGCAATPAAVGPSLPQAPPPLAQAAAPTPTRVPGFVRELTTIPVALPGGAAAHLDALITRPDTPGRRPLVLLSHGSPRDPAERAKMAPTILAAQSLAFARRGYAVVVVMRRGFGATGGRFVEGRGPCESSNYERSGRTSAEDVLAALDHLRGEAWVDPERILLVGHSAGGFAAVAAASQNPKGVRGVVSFAGGRGSDEADHVCQPERLVAAVGAFGETARVPMVWVYRENDHFFSPALARQMADAYRGAGAPLDLDLGPPFGDDGHAYFLRAPPEEWWPLVAGFLEKVQLPIALEAPRDAAPALPPPPTLLPAGRDDFAHYLASEGYEKAFAVGGATWGWVSGRRTTAEATADALTRCQQRGRTCKVYAVGNTPAP